MIRFTRATAVGAFLMAAQMQPAANAAGVDVAAFIKKDEFSEIEISPTGEYFAATVPLEDRTVLVILRREDSKVAGTANLGKNKHIYGFWWGSDKRIVFGGAQKFGELDTPLPTGDLYAINADGKGAEVLIGQHLDVMTTGTRVQQKKPERVAAFVVDPLRDNDREMVITVMPFGDDPFTTAERLDIETGRRVRIARAPVRNGTFVTDQSGEVRAVHGVGTNNVHRLYVRSGKGDDWKLINDELASDRIEQPVGFSEDNSVMYLWAQRAQGPDEIVAYDLTSGNRTSLVSDDDTDPERILYSPSTKAPIGVRFMDGKPRTEFFDKQSPDARQYRSLEAAFPGHSPLVTSRTKDGRQTLVLVSSDRNPGDYYLFDTVGKSAALAISRRSWFDPETMGERRPVKLSARDGLPLAGYLTLPHGSAGKSLPMVVLPHGGPYGIYDDWFFDGEAQLLAAAGYAVLQVNFRGSGNHGRAFLSAGAREWGARMQDDVTDATRWAVQQGIADPGRICIYGNSYGGYAALMGVAREPDLYRCAAGYVGVYNLPTMLTQGDIQRRGSGEAYLKKWLGSADELAKVSPTKMAERIKAPVFIAAGGEDQRAPIEHSKMMERSLVAAGVPVETLYYPTEGHGFYVDAHREEFYTRLLAFLGRHIGGATAAN